MDVTKRTQWRLWRGPTGHDVPQLVWDALPAIAGIGRQAALSTLGRRPPVRR